ncbi:hypothetical protein NECAME_08324 [Necator americanus]|uniref:Uncharacterized protein n=1 Tax=Necator americanus TaxID=51031 RepID=W2TJC6_NECAM|nr:hypothetical protein NECAME_08324 [Necator americanus]ETN81699.1 hypothetical protein NECAME_08324 [Necator americanus]
MRPLSSRSNSRRRRRKRKHASRKVVLATANELFFCWTEAAQLKKKIESAPTWCAVERNLDHRRLGPAGRLLMPPQPSRHGLMCSSTAEGHPGEDSQSTSIGWPTTVFHLCVVLTLFQLGAEKMQSRGLLKLMGNCIIAFPNGLSALSMHLSALSDLVS